jgi:hypothetical protein
VTSPDDVVVLLDCDNTLLDNDLVPVDLRAHLAREFGVEGRDRYRAILERLPAEVGYVDYLGALPRDRLGAVTITRSIPTTSSPIRRPISRSSVSAIWSTMIYPPCPARPAPGVCGGEQP